MLYSGMLDCRFETVNWSIADYRFETVHWSIADCRSETVNWSIAGCCSEIAGYYSGTADSGMAYPEIADSGKAVPETEYFPESRNYFRVWQSGYRTGCRIYIEAEVLFHSLRNT